MKIVCDACQAKYSISDDKVQGKVFKIRCKKCSNIIVVRGGAGAAEAAPAPAQEKETRVYDYGYDGAAASGGSDEAVWHLVINQDQVGPMTAAEVQAKFAGGEVDGETFTWREGFADWLPLSQVDAFAAMVAAGTTQAHSGGGGAAAVSSMFGGGGGDEAGTMRSDPGDLFAAASSTASRGHDDDDGNDLFGGGKPAAVAQQSAASAGAGPKLRGERNENSVLFSLNNLAQLASDKPAPAAAKSPAMSAGPAGHATGAAGGEGSGLIDIRSMANAYLGAQPGGAAKPASAGVGSIDDLPVFGGGGFSEPAVLVPTAVASRGNNKILYGMIGAVALLAVAAVVMVVILLKNNKSSSKDNDKVAMADKGSAAGATGGGDTAQPDKIGGAAAAGSATTPDTKAPEANAGSAAAEKTAETPTPPPTEDKTEKTAEKTEKTERETPSRTTTTHRSSGGSTVASRETHRETTPPPPPKDTGGGGCDEVSCVLNNYEGACCAKFKKGKTGGGGSTTSSRSDLPDALDRAMISAGVANVKGRVTACGDRSSAKGKVKVHVKVGADGRVSGVSVETTPDPALGACVASAMNKATFAKTQTGGSFSYPFVF